MPTFGVTSTGFNAPSVRDLLDLIEADQLSGISATLDVSSDSPFGQANGIVANYLAQAWEALAACYSGFDPDKAEGVLLTMLSKLSGTQRAAATQSTAVCSVTADIGTILIAGTHFASVAGKPDVRFTPKTTFTSSVTGVTTGTLWVSENTGPIQAPANAVTVIATPVVGWSAITNPLAASPGSNVESDADLRLSRQLELTASGSATVDSIKAKLVILLQGVTGATVAMFNNPSDTTDVNGLPPHSFEAVVWDPSSTFTNNQIAQVIWDNKPAGVQSYGATIGNALDSSLATQPISFSRAVAVPIYISATLAHRPGFIDNATFANAWAQGLSQGIVVKDVLGNLDTILAQYATGAPVTSYDLTLATQGLGAKVSALTFGTSPSPVTSADIAIGTRQIAVFSSTRIVLTP